MLDKIISQFGLQLLSVNEAADSFSSTVYKCTLLNRENVFIKIPYTQLKFQRELEAYEILKGQVAIPEMLNYWPGDEECPGAFLLSQLKGNVLTAEASPQVAFQVGVIHAEMHSVQPPPGKVLTGLKNELPDWPIFIEKQFNSFAEDVREVLDHDLYNKAIARFLKMKQELPSPDGPSFIHMDFRPANIIVDHDKVSGIIDFESVRFGSTEIDFTKLYRDFLSLDSAKYKAYKDGYNSVRTLIDLEAVLPFYRLTDAFNSIGWCKRRGMKKNAAFYEENLEILKKLL